MSYVLLQKVEDGPLQAFSEDVYDTFDEAQTVAQKAWAEGDELIVGELKLDSDWEKPMCAAQTFGGSLYEPPEYCENETVLGSEYCSQHCDERL